MDTLKAANAAKNQALKDTASGESQRMKDLATTDGLKKVVTLATSKANLAAASTALKAADAEETKQLKIKIKNLNKKAADAQADLKDYESTAKDEKPAEETPAEEITTAPKKDSNEDKIAKIESDITKVNKNIETAKATQTKAEQELEQAGRDKDLGRTSDEAIAKIKKKIEDAKEDIVELKAEEKSLKAQVKKLQPKESVEITEDRASEIEKMIKDKAKPKTLVPKDSLPPSVGEELKEKHVEETMTDKFRRLMAKHNVQSS
jgi:DNA repair exonuclease SbcCD ATPase subunit